MLGRKLYSHEFKGAAVTSIQPGWAHTSDTYGQPVQRIHHDGNGNFGFRLDSGGKCKAGVFRCWCGVAGSSFLYGIG